MTVLQRGVGSVERAQVRDQPELHFTITESLYKVFVRELPTRWSFSIFTSTMYTIFEEGIFSIFTICKEGVFSRIPLFHSHFHSRLLTTSEKDFI